MVNILVQTRGSPDLRRSFIQERVGTKPELLTVFYYSLGRHVYVEVGVAGAVNPQLLGGEDQLGLPAPLDEDGGGDGAAQNPAVLYISNV